MSDEPSVWIERSARKHGVTDEDVRHAITHAFNISDMTNIVDDTKAVLVLGPDRAGTPLKSAPC